MKKESHSTLLNYFLQIKITYVHSAEWEYIIILLKNFRHNPDINKLINYLVLSCIFLIIIDFSLQPILTLDTDMYWHLSGGREIWNLQNPFIERFSHTKFGSQWLDYSWGFQSILYLFYIAGNFDGVILLRTILFLLSMIFLYHTARLRECSILTSSVSVLMASFIIKNYFWIRPYFISLFMSCLLLFILELSIKKYPRLSWCIPLLMMFWINFHGGVSLIGMVIIITYALVDTFEKRMIYKKDQNIKTICWIKIIPLCFLALFINPKLGETVLFAFTWIKPNPFKSIILEYARPDFLSATSHFSLLFIILSFISSIYIIKKRRFFDIFLFIPFSLLIFSSFRHQYQLLPLLAPTIACFFEELKKRLTHFIIFKNDNFLKYIKILCILCLLIISFREGMYVFRKGYPPSRLIRWEKMPEGACRFILYNNIKGNLFNSLNLGGYFIWRLTPSCHVYIDSRDDQIYDEKILNEYFNILYDTKEGWEAINKRNIDIIIYQYEDFPFFNKLVKSKDWFLAYEDESKTRVYLRKSKYYEKSKSFCELNDYFITYLSDGKYFLSNFETDKAIYEFNRALSLYPYSPACHFELGNAYAQKGSLSYAMRQWEIIILIDPAFSNGCYYHMARASFEAGYPQMAACYLSEELKRYNNQELKDFQKQLPYHNHKWCFIKYKWRNFWAPFFLW